MGIHMNLDYHEPPGGDFVALIDAMVGAPPEDPELSSKEIAARLVERSRQNREMAETGAMPSNSEHPGGIGGPPDVADALESIARSGLKRLVSFFGFVLILAGIALFIISINMPGLAPMLEPQYAAAVFFVGLVLRNMAS